MVPTSCTRGHVRLLDAGEVAAYLKVSEWTVRDWVRQGRIPHVKLGRALRFRESDLESFVCARVVGETSDPRILTESTRRPRKPPRSTASTPAPTTPDLPKTGAPQVKLLP